MRTLGSNGETTERLLRQAGVKLIARHGYDAVSLRHLAKEVGIQAGSLYNYINNKQDFLFQLLVEIIQDLNEEMETAMAGVEEPYDMLCTFIRAHIKFHTSRKNEVFIGNMELRSLTRENRKQIVAMRNEYEARLEEILRLGREQGVFHFVNPKVVRLALFAMLTQIANWYDPKGDSSIEELTAQYIDLSSALLRVPEEYMRRAETVAAT